MKRGFYSVATSVFAENGEDTKTPSDFRSVVLATHGTDSYLHSAVNPNEPLEAAGGTLIAADWPALKAALAMPVKDKVFRTLVEREAGPLTLTLFLPRVAVLPTDVVVTEWMPPHKFLGDPDPMPVP